MPVASEIEDEEHIGPGQSFSDGTIYEDARAERMAALEARRAAQIAPFMRYMEAPPEDADENDPRRIFWDTLNASNSPFMDKGKLQQFEQLKEVREEDSAADDKQYIALDMEFTRRVGMAMEAAGYIDDARDPANGGTIEKVTDLVKERLITKRNDWNRSQEQRPARSPQQAQPAGGRTVAGRGGMQRRPVPDARPAMEPADCDCD